MAPHRVKSTPDSWICELSNAGVSVRLMTMREERAGKRHKGDIGTGNGESLELQSPTVQEMEEFLNVKMSPRVKASLPSLEDVQRGDNKHVVESRTDQDSMDDGYRCISSRPTRLLLCGRSL